ncbi:MAG TPA: alkaline phosphatase [Candidatus Avacidaminococcus intestinavium]|uniref:Alkaline phosphatase n=1 Tax=Candidatus Avacidaminococcus intestinavium TaxID=2840684 RepID=A0A9D1MNE0_9FIRM|nr:alkaline phosphatase [Candidatus Avacidaminococcus intestinavium]
MLGSTLSGIVPNSELPLVHAAAYSMVNKSPVTILPIDRAKFVVGQQFDFLIEVENVAPQDIKVLIDGKDAATVFGKEAKVSKAGSISTYRIDQVKWNKAGNVRINVEANNLKRSVEYVVVADKAVKKAKNVILMIGDGMSLQSRQIARILSKGINEGKYNDLLEMEKMSNMALITTSGYDSLVTDSANSASAYATGHKGVVNSMGTYADSTKDPFDDPKVENIVELVKRTKNMSVGLVSTSNITDATPAAMITHTRKRSEQNYIAQDFLAGNHKPDVILGGGSRHFLPQSIPGSKRKDEKNLIEAFKKDGYNFSDTQTSLRSTPKDAKKILGLYNLDNMNVYLDRAMLKNPDVLGGFNDQPGLVEMTTTAINSLKQNPNGFFLMVEGACIDKQLHTMDWQRAAYDNIEFDKAIGEARKFAAQNNDTLVIVVADHSHGSSITGTYHELDGKTGREAVRTYADAGFPSFVDANKDGYPDNPDAEITLAVHFANHPDANIDYRFKEKPMSPAIMADGKAIANPMTTGEFYKGNIPANESSEVHSADDIILNAEGPGAEYFHGVLDNTEVFFGMVRALGINGNKNSK